MASVTASPFKKCLKVTNVRQPAGATLFHIRPYLRVMLTIKNITKRFGAQLANDNISLNVAAGHIYGLLGPNGAGKTTLIRMITNIIMPDEGEILLDGSMVSAIEQNSIGYLPEERGLYKKLTVAEQLTYFGQLKGLDGREALKRGSWWLARMDASGWESKKVQELSKGMQQKVQFISTVLHEPKLVILDEPFSGLDPVNSDILIGVIKELQQRGTTIILSTHQMDQVERLCDDIALINKGRVVLNGSVRDVRAGFRSDRIYLDYHGQDEPMRNIPGTAVVDSAAGRVELRLVDPSVHPTDILRSALSHVEITRFEVAEPSLHDIFVQTVKESVTTQ